MSILTSSAYPRRHADRAPRVIASRRTRRALAGTALHAGLSVPVDADVTQVLDARGAAAEKLSAPKFECPKTSLKLKITEPLHPALYKPVYSLEETSKRYAGLQLGALQAVTELPMPGVTEPKPVYYFTRALKSGQHAQQQKVEYVHYIMGQETLDALYTAARTGMPTDEAMQGVVVLGNGLKGQVVIGTGKGNWLPDRGYNEERVRDEEYKCVSGEQTLAYTDMDGALVITDDSSHNGTYAYRGAPAETTLAASTGQFEQVPAA